MTITHSEVHVPSRLRWIQTCNNALRRLGPHSSAPPAHLSERIRVCPLWNDEIRARGGNERLNATRSFLLHDFDFILVSSSSHTHFPVCWMHHSILDNDNCVWVVCWVVGWLPLIKIVSNHLATDRERTDQAIGRLCSSAFLCDPTILMNGVHSVIYVDQRLWAMMPGTF